MALGKQFCFQLETEDRQKQIVEPTLEKMGGEETLLKLTSLLDEKNVGLLRRRRRIVDCCFDDWSAFAEQWLFMHELFSDFFFVNLVAGRDKDDFAHLFTALEATSLGATCLNDEQLYFLSALNRQLLQEPDVWGIWLSTQVCTCALCMGLTP